MYDPTKPYKKEILSLIKSTWDTPYVKITPSVYPLIHKKFTYTEVQHTDGIGTKGFFHWKKRTFRAAVLDALAMNLNDLALVGATPYALQNHIVLPKDDHTAILTLVRELSRECCIRKIAMTGGETSVHSDVHGLDISITVSGFIKKVRQNKCKAGDILIGLPSNGLHSNGITKAREILGTKYRFEFTEPTTIYLDSLLPLLARYSVHGMMHITGGAFTKLKDILEDCDAVINQPSGLAPQKIFFDIYKKGVSSRGMYSTFNCGTGFILTVAKKDVTAILKRIPGAAIIGQIVEGEGVVKISSAFENRTVKL